MEILNFIIPFIVLLTVVVFVHEYGHYYFAKKYGVGVTDFSIGFGREIFGINDKNGTRWKFCINFSQLSPLTKDHLLFLEVR